MSRGRTETTGLPLTLHLLRHAKSSWDDPRLDDHERPLNKRGRRAAKAMGRFLAETPPAPDRVLCSSAARTRETWERVARELGAEPAVEILDALYLAPTQRMLEVLRAVQDAPCVLVIGHNPGIEDFARRLAGGGDANAWERMRARYPTAALATLAFPAARWPEVTPAAGELVRFTTPHDL